MDELWIKTRQALAAILGIKPGVWRVRITQQACSTLEVEVWLPANATENEVIEEADRIANAAPDDDWTDSYDDERDYDLNYE